MLWLDADIVVFRDPWEAMKAAAPRDDYDVAIQQYLGMAEVVAEQETSLLLPELCAGVIYARATALSLRLVQAMLHRQVRYVLGVRGLVLGTWVSRRRLTCGEERR